MSIKINQAAEPENRNEKSKNLQGNRKTGRVGR